MNKKLTRIHKAPNSRSMLPIVAHASFVMNSKEQIMQVIHDYQDGKMGQL